MQTVSLTNTSEGALIDDRDYKLISPYRWRKDSAGYASCSTMRNGRPYTLLMHRLILGTPDHIFTDHVNRNRLDNQRHNLRFTNFRNNSRNRSAANGRHFLGVSQRTGGRASVIIRVAKPGQTKGRGHQVYLGTFETELVAAAAYNIGASHIHGDFAALNPVAEAPEPVRAEVMARLEAFYNRESPVRCQGVSRRRLGIVAGIYHPRAKFSEEQVIAIRAEYEMGDVSASALARRHGVDRSTIGNIVRCRRYKRLALQAG